MKKTFILLLISLLAVSAVLAQTIEKNYNDATCGPDNTSWVMRPGEQKTVTMTFNNNGKSTWTKGGANYYYIAVPPGMASSFGVPYVALPSESVPPGSSAAFSFTITAPSTPGIYQLKYQMAQQGVEFFGKQYGPEKVVVWQPADSLIRDMKEKGCVWSGLITTAKPMDSWIESKFDEYADLLKRSACSYLSYSIETWITPPNSTKIATNIERIRQATGKEYIYEMMIAEAIPAHNSGTWWFNKEYAGFNFPAMCSDLQPMDYGRPNTCIPSLNKPEYRRYVKYITEKAIDNGVQSFLFGQVYFQDEKWKTAPAIPEVVAEMRAYALSKGKDIVIGAGTNDIDDGDYLRNFDFINSVTAQDENGNIETDRDCHSCCPPGPIYQCLALLWHDRFRLPAQSNKVAILIVLDYGTSIDDDIHKFARMSRESRANFLNSVYSFLKGKDIGFLTPMLVGLWPLKGTECRGSEYMYSASNQYTCKDEDVINILLLKSSNPRNSVCVSHTIPTSMTPGEERDVSITLKNTGDLAWTQPDYDLALINYPEPPWSPYALELPLPMVLPGNSATYAFKIRAPAKTGVYSAQYKLFQRDVTAFGEACGPAAVDVCVSAGGFCGGIAGVKCCSGLKCQLEGNYADAGGKCVKEVSKACTDSDGGKDYYIKGTVTLVSESKTDSCTYCTGLCQQGQPCNPTCGGVVEYYCESGMIKSEEHVCSNNCEDGACIPEIRFCSGCGKGALNVCDIEECESIPEGCYFISRTLSNSCKSCKDGVSCGSYDGDEMTCAEDPCRLGGCRWDGGSCTGTAFSKKELLPDEACNMQSIKNAIAVFLKGQMSLDDIKELLAGCIVF